MQKALTLEKMLKYSHISYILVCHLQINADRYSGMGKNRDPIRIRDEHPGLHFRELKKQFLCKNKVFDADPGWKKFGSGLQRDVVYLGALV
jgi:hypothetical protein